MMGRNAGVKVYLHHHDIISLLVFDAIDVTVMSEHAISDKNISVLCTSVAHIGKR